MTYSFSTDFKENLGKHGAVLYRGFPVTEPGKFDLFLQNVKGISGMAYSLGTGSRTGIQGSVGSTENINCKCLRKPDKICPYLDMHEKS